jgi:hypothetical protein
MYGLIIISALIILVLFLPLSARDWFRRRLLIAAGSGLGLILVAVFVLFFQIFVGFDNVPALLRFFPSDEEMIGHFRKHRAEFDRLVQIYREDLSVPVDVVGYLLPTPEVKAIMDRINVTHVRDDQVPWIPPEPYSRDAGIQSEHTKFLVKADRSEKRKYASVVLHYDHPKVLRLKYMGPVWKKYCYTPLVPRIRDGKLWFPIVSLLAYGTGPVVQSLNTYPPDLGPFDCAYREIEPHWFVRMYQDPDH